MFLLIRNWDYFPKGRFNKKPRNFRLTMMQSVKEMKKNSLIRLLQSLKSYMSHLMELNQRKNMLSTTLMNASKARRKWY